MNRQAISKTRQSASDRWSEFVDSLVAFDPDVLDGAAVALRVEATRASHDLPMHSHRRGQLVMATHGSVRCDVADGFWTIPPRCALWIPAGHPHRSQVSAKGRIIFLYIAPGSISLPDACCTLLITPLVEELIRHLAAQKQDYDPSSPTARLVDVLLEQLQEMPTTRLHLPVPKNPRLAKIADALFTDPANRNTVAQWAASVALTERTLARLIHAELGMSFGRWRQQLHIIVALQQLAEGTAVQSVSQQLGYESVSAFITMFKKMMGHPPGHYLQRADSA
ncbi:MAG TPA: helix-turn-helix transcriptional regulator [Bordetella sp.]